MKNSASPRRSVKSRKKYLTKRQYHVISLGGYYNQGGILQTGMIVQTFVLLMLTWGRGDTDIGAEWNPTGNPVGGGPGYSASVTSWDYYVTDLAELDYAPHS